MCHALLQSPNFFELLSEIDHELAAQARAEGCLHCGGLLHGADYPRKPRGCLTEARADYGKRLSFCCNRCRKRRTSLSVRFLGRRVYLGLLVVLASARHAGQMPAAARFGEELGVPVRTLERWRRWWQTDFVVTPLWQAQCARFMPPVEAERLPGGLLDRFAGEAQEALMRLLYFLAPLSIRPLIVVGEGR